MKEIIEGKSLLHFLGVNNLKTSHVYLFKSGERIRWQGNHRVFVLVYSGRNQFGQICYEIRKHTPDDRRGIVFAYNMGPCGWIHQGIFPVRKTRVVGADYLVWHHISLETGRVKTYPSYWQLQQAETQPLRVHPHPQRKDVHGDDWEPLQAVEPRQLQDMVVGWL